MKEKYNVKSEGEPSSLFLLSYQLIYFLLQYGNHTVVILGHFSISPQALCEIQIRKETLT